MVANRAYTFTKFCEGLDEIQKSKWFRLHAPTQHFYTSNHGFIVTTMQQQTSFFIRNDTYVKLLYLKSKNEIGIYIRCNYQTTTDFFRHNKWYHCKLSLYLWNTKKYQTQKCRINETVLLGTQNIKPWLQIWLPCLQFLHGFQKSNITTVKLISLKLKKSVYTL